MMLTTWQGTRRMAIVACLLLVVPVLLLAPDSVAESRRPKPKTKKVQAVGEWAFKRLQHAQELLGEEKYGDATKELDRMKDRRRLNDHERALMWQTYGYIHSAQERYEEAAESFAKSLEKNALAESAALSTQYNLGQLYLAIERFDKALKTLLDWYGKTETPSADAEYTLAVAHVQSGRHAEAIPYVKRAIAGSSKPREGWYQLLLSLHFELKQYREVANLLEVMVLQFPKKAYWKQLSGIYGELKQEKKSLAALQLAYSQGLLDERRDLVNLANLYLYHEVPYRAAHVLEKGIEDGIVEPDVDTWELLSNSWLHAKEYDRALAPLTKAAQMSEDGDLFVKLAQVHLQREDWVKVREALELAVDKGDLSNPGNAYVLLGIANYNTKQLNAATQAFREARKHDKQRKTANQWLEHIRQEQQSENG
jgi:tetratricopeptide (TPR) repeat protein